MGRWGRYGEVTFGNIPRSGSVPTELWQILRFKTTRPATTEAKSINISEFYLIIPRKMRKEIKRIGSSIGFTFNKEEQKTYGLKLGNIIEISPKKIKDKP